MEVLNESTLIPIGFVITMAASLIAAVKWAVGVQNTGKENSRKIKHIEERLIPEIRGDQKETNDKLDMVHNTVSNIEGKLDFLVDHAKKHN